MQLNLISHLRNDIFDIVGKIVRKSQQDETPNKHFFCILFPGAHVKADCPVW